MDLKAENLELRQLNRDRLLMIPEEKQVDSLFLSFFEKAANELVTPTSEGLAEIKVLAAESSGAYQDFFKVLADLIGFVPYFEKRQDIAEIVAIEELYLLSYHSFTDEAKPFFRPLADHIYYFFFDYAEMFIRDLAEEIERGDSTWFDSLSIDSEALHTFWDGRLSDRYQNALNGIRDTIKEETYDKILEGGLSYAIYSNHS